MLNTKIRQPLLTKEEEVKLAKRIEQGDIEARNEFVEKNIGLVQRVVSDCTRKYNLTPEEVEDVTQQGYIKLLSIVKDFDFTRGYKFSTFATTSLKRAVPELLKDSIIGIRNSKKVPINRMQLKDEIYEYINEQKNLGKEITINSAIDFFAQLKGIERSKIIDILYGTKKVLSLENIFEREGFGILDKISDPSLKLEISCGETIKRKKLDFYLSLLPERMADVVKFRVGLLDKELSNKYHLNENVLNAFLEPRMRNDGSFSRASFFSFNDIQRLMNFNNSPRPHQLLQEGINLLKGYAFFQKYFPTQSLGANLEQINKFFKNFEWNLEESLLKKELKIFINPFKKSLQNVVSIKNQKEILENYLSKMQNKNISDFLSLFYKVNMESLCGKYFLDSSLKPSLELICEKFSFKESFAKSLVKRYEKLIDYFSYGVFAETLTEARKLIIDKYREIAKRSVKYLENPVQKILSLNYGLNKDLTIKDSKEVSRITQIPSRDIPSLLNLGFEKLWKRMKILMAPENYPIFK